jgi:hypothetical protein
MALEHSQYASEYVEPRLVIAYQIVIKGNEVSEAYAKISLESFQPLVDAGVISEIRTFDAITPESDNYQENLDRYTWAKSLMRADVLSENTKEMHSPTEMAGMCSHWELMRMASEVDEDFIVLEHDSYFNGDVGQFRQLCEMDVLYRNIGLFMGCYSLESKTAGWMYNALTNAEFPINCGPYCTLQRLFATYTTDVLKKQDFRGRATTVIHPWASCTTLYFGRNVQRPFNKPDKNEDTNEWRLPSTQVVSKSMKVTQDHHGYKEGYIEEPWTKNKNLLVIE